MKKRSTGFFSIPYVYYFRMNHTNNELELMLSGNKPLAVFGEEESFLPDEEIIPELAFSKYVKEGIFLREEFILESQYSEKLERNARIKHVLYCIPSEQWRIPAMSLLIAQFNITGQ